MGAKPTFKKGVNPFAKKGKGAKSDAKCAKCGTKNCKC